MFAILYEMTLVFGHASTPMTSEYVAELLQLGTATYLLSPPSILEELAKDPSGLRELARLKHVAYGGGPLRPEIGNNLAEVLPHLFSQIGATEMGWHHLIVGGNEFWDSLRWYDDIGYKFEEISEGIFEHVVVNDKRTNKYQYVFDIFPGLSEYRTKDLYAPHPTAAGWWKYRGRADDLIVLSNGEKINPIPMENTIRSDPLVNSALVVGEYRFSPSLLVEMKSGHAPETDVERLEAVKQIWPSVDEANRIAPGFAKIPKSLILFTKPEKPFQRAGKGTVQRRLTVKSYSEELDQLFLSQQNDLLIEGLTLDRSNTQDNIRTFTRQIYRQAIELDDLSDSDDVFHRGMDSLKVLVVVQRLRAAVATIGCHINLEKINARLIYSASTVDKMTEAILDLVTKPKGTEQEQKNAVVSRGPRMRHLLKQYSRNLPTSVPVGKQANSLRTILLTGSTGSLGSYLLAALESLPNSEVDKVYCLNRSQNSKEKQRKSNLDRGLNIDWDDERIEFLQADLSRLDLGLGAEKYAEILSNTTVIIHNAWQVNFNLALDSFEPQIQGVRNLLDFSAQSSHKARLVFVSSVSAAHRWMELHPDQIVPEAVLDDFDAPGQLGYSESKFICEHLVQEFSKSSGIPGIIMRTGQIAGPLKGHGVWNRQEWLPSIIASSKYLGVLPETLGTMEAVDWIPVDLLASIMIELVKTSTQKNEALTTVYNLVNPVSTTWSALATHVQNIAGI